MKSVSSSDFNEVINRDCQTLIMFQAKDCPPCATMKERMDGLIPSSVDPYLFDVYQENARPIRVNYKIGIVPRASVFKAGEPIGSIFLLRDEAYITRFFDELKANGFVPTSTDDTEAVTHFYNRFFKLLNAKIDLSGTREEKANFISETADTFINRHTDWNKSSDGTILDYISKI